MKKVDMIMRPSELLEAHRTEVLEIFSRYPMVTNLRIVGSVARGEDTENSDLDFLVDTASGTTLFDLGGLLEDLQDLLGIHVDILTSGGRMHPYMKETIERDARAI